MEQDQKQSPLLVVSNLTLKHQRADTSTTILRDVSFELRAGEILGLIGESGAGKSTLGNAVLGLLAPGFSQTGGRILFRGQAFDEMSDKDRMMVRGRRISAIFQDHTASLDPLMSVGSQIVETIQALDGSLTARQARAHALDLMERVGIQDPAGRYSQYPHQFSGGQRQRIVIAIALAGKPDIIVADEPTSALDATVQKQILALLRKLTEETGVSIILVTHDMGVISEIADRVVVMRHGKVVEQGVTSSILDAPAEPYTHDLLAAVPRLRLSGIHQSPVLSHGAEPAGDGIDPAGPVGPRSVMSVKGVTKTFAHRSLPWLRSDRQSFALQDVTIEIERGAITGIVGESGSGKSTIGRIVAGLETANQGTLEIDGAGFDISRSGRKSGLLGQVQMIFQDPAMSLNPRMSVGSALEESLRSGNRGSKSYAHEVGDLMDRLGLPRILLKSFPHQLSGGQKQRVCIARALLARPSIIVADEPTSALDVSVQAEIVTLLKETVRERGLSMLFISHDLALVQDLCHAIYIFKDGIVEDSGLTDFIFSQSDNPYTRRLIDARPLRFTHRPPDRPDLEFEFCANQNFAPFHHAGTHDMTNAFTVAVTGQSLIKHDIRTLETPGFEAVRKTLSKSDFAFTNFESTIFGSHGGWPMKGSFFGSSQPVVLDTLQSLGFHGLSLSNNHAYDLGSPGILSTLEEVERRGFLHAGIGRNRTAAARSGLGSVAGRKIALVAMDGGPGPDFMYAADAAPGRPERPGINRLKLTQIIDVDSQAFEQLAAIRDKVGYTSMDLGNDSQPDDKPMVDDLSEIALARGLFRRSETFGRTVKIDPDDLARNLAAITSAATSDCLVVAYLHHHHWASDWYQVPGWVGSVARQCVDAGAHMFVSHGAPVLQPLEIYQGRPIFYSLGNFVFHIRPGKSKWTAREVWESVIGLCTFNEIGSLTGIAFHPVIIGGPEGLKNEALDQRLAPEIATGEDGQRILQRFQQQCAQFGTSIRISEDVGYYDTK